MDKIHFTPTYSSTVAIYLEVAGRTIRLGELLRNEGTLLDRVEIAANTEAILVVEIDGSRRQKRVVLDNGISPNSNRVCFSYPIDQAA